MKLVIESDEMQLGFFPDGTTLAYHILDQRKDMTFHPEVHITQFHH